MSTPDTVSGVFGGKASLWWSVTAGFAVLSAVAFRIAGSVAVALAPLVFGALLVAVLAVVRELPWLPAAILLMALPVLSTQLPAGLELVHLLAAGVAGLSLLVALLTGRLTGSWILGLGLAVAVGMLLATLNARQVMLSLRGSLVFLLAVAVCAAVVQLWPRTDHVRWLFRAWIIAVAYSLLPHLAVPTPQAVELGGGVVRDRLEGIFTQPNYLGELCLLTLFLSLAFLWWSPQWYDRLLSIVGVIVALLAGSFSLSRGSFIGIGVGLVVLAILVAKARVPVLAGLATMGGVILILALVGNSFATVLLARIGSITAAERNPSDARDLIWGEALHMWQGSPALGVGIGEYRFTSAFSGTLLAPGGAWHAHNIVLQVGAEAGVAGVVILAGCALLGLAFTLQALRDVSGRFFPPEVIAALLAGLCGVAAHGMVDFVYNHPVLLMLLAVYLGLLAIGTKQTADGTP